MTYEYNAREDNNLFRNVCLLMLKLKGLIKTYLVKITAARVLEI